MEDARNILFFKKERILFEENKQTGETKRKPGTQAASKTRVKAIGIRVLVSYRLQKATYFATKGAYLFYANRHGITPVEWRLLGNLYADGTMSVVRLADEVDIQLAQASRTISSLIKRELVIGQANPHDGRSVDLSLTPKGKALYRKLLAEATRYHDRLMESLAQDEQKVLLQALEKLAEVGQQLLREEQERG